jgi:large subunit ribosomal protein L35
MFGRRLNPAAIVFSGRGTLGGRSSGWSSTVPSAGQAPQEPIAFSGTFCHKPRLDRTARLLGLPWRFRVAQAAIRSVWERFAASKARPKESKMPKLKTKSGAKKRFKITGTGKVMYAQSGKRHGMIKRTKKQIRNLRGTTTMFKTDGDNIKKFFLPNG